MINSILILNTEGTEVLCQIHPHSNLLFKLKFTPFQYKIRTTNYAICLNGSYLLTCIELSRSKEGLISP